MSYKVPFFSKIILAQFVIMMFLFAVITAIFLIELIRTGHCLSAGCLIVSFVELFLIYTLYLFFTENRLRSISLPTSVCKKTSDLIEFIRIDARNSGDSVHRKSNHYLLLITNEPLTHPGGYTRHHWIFIFTESEKLYFGVVSREDRHYTLDLFEPMLTRIWLHKQIKNFGKLCEK